MRRRSPLRSGRSLLQRPRTPRIRRRAGRRPVDLGGVEADARRMNKRADRQGMMGPYGVRYSWAYWAAILGAFALLVVDIVDDSASWNSVVIVFMFIAIALRPGGLRGPRAASRGDE